MSKNTPASKGLIPFRSVPFVVRCALLLFRGRFALIVWGLLATALPFTMQYFAISAVVVRLRAYPPLAEAAGVITRIVDTETPSTHSTVSEHTSTTVQYTYTYVTPDRRSFRGVCSRKVHLDEPVLDGKKIDLAVLPECVGDWVTVEYSVRNPSVSRIIGMRYGIADIDWFLYPTLFVFGLLYLCAWYNSGYVKVLQCAKVLVYGRVLSSRKKPPEYDPDTGHQITYVNANHVSEILFTTTSGEDRVITYESGHLLREAEPILVAYEPDCFEKADAFGRVPRGIFSVDDQGRIIPDPRIWWRFMPLCVNILLAVLGWLSGLDVLQKGGADWSIIPNDFIEQSLYYMHAAIT